MLQTWHNPPNAEIKVISLAGAELGSEDWGGGANSSE